MFIRAVWRQRRLIDTVRREIVLSTRNAAIPGVCAPDFSKMTRGLFDRRR